MVQESATEVVWPRKEARPRLRRKKDSGDGTTRKRKRGRLKQRWMDCVNRDTTVIGTTKDDVLGESSANLDNSLVLFSSIL